MIKSILQLEDREAVLEKLPAKPYKQFKTMLAKLSGKVMFDENALSDDDLDLLIATVVEIFKKQVTREEVEECSIDDLFAFITDIQNQLEYSVVERNTKVMQDFFTKSADLLSAQSRTGGTSQMEPLRNSNENE